MRIGKVCVNPRLSGKRLSQKDPKIPYIDHTRLQPQILNLSSFKEQNARRVEKFVATVTSSEDMPALFVGERTQEYNWRIQNRARIKISFSVSKSNNFRANSPTEGVSELPDLLGNACKIRELIDARDVITELGGFTYDELSSIIHDLCCG